MGYEGTVNGALGITTSKVVNEDGADLSSTTYFASEYGDLNTENLQKLIADTYEESVLEQEEGSVLLKNENNALPLASDEMRVTLFGHSVVQPVYKNASAGSSGYKGAYCVDLKTALQDAGFAVNETLYDAYAKSSTTRSTGVAQFGQEQTSYSFGEEEKSFYTQDLQNSWADDYNDAAIVLLSREGGEGTEIKTSDEDGISQLALHQEEKDLLQMIKDSGKFKKTIVLINSGNAMELGWLDEYNVDACLWIGLPGQRGFEGVANLLKGDANPSGHLTDTYAVNSLSAPAVVNGSFNNQNWTNLDYVLEQSDETDSAVSWYTVQAEGIYIGYKYYETRYEDTILGQGNADSAKGSSDGNAWSYTAEVSYPFGYGLSYTTFEQTLDNVEVKEDSVTATVTVTNTGDIAGKSVVEIYAQTPYGDYYEKPEDAGSVADYTLGENKDIPLAAMIGKDFDDAAWDEYLNQFTLEELASVTADNFGTSEITSVGKPAIVAGDGPDGVGGTFDKTKYGDDRNDCAFPCENILASTYNKDLLTRRGELMGEEALYLGMGYVWMPGVNLHRTPFGGRNFEYYSEDANMNYLCASETVNGMAEKGVHAGAKHLAGNDQENNREGISVFFNEQAFREGALRGCESALTQENSMAVMHAFNRLGMTWSSASEVLCTQVVRNEWGFMGFEETDAVAGGNTFKTHFTSTLNAGTNVYCLDFAGDSSRAVVGAITANDDGHLLGKLRETAHYYLYTIANSAIMNGYSTDSKVVTVTPWWKPVMYTLIGVFAVFEILFLALSVKSRKKSEIIVEEADK